MSGQSKYRDLWQQHYDQSEAIIFVIDSSDTIRMQVAKNELEELLSNKGLIEREVPILFFANKQDLGMAQSASEISNTLELHDITDRSWKI